MGWFACFLWIYFFDCQYDDDKSYDILCNVNFNVQLVVITQYRQWKYTVEGTYLQNQAVQFQPQHQYSLMHRQLLQAEDENDSAAKFKQSIPRYNLEGKRVSSTLLININLVS